MSDSAGPPTSHRADGFVTGDAVVVELRYAKLPSRSLAFGIDLIIAITAMVLLTMLVGALGGFVDSVMLYVAVFVATIGVFVGYPVACETLTGGRTVGKIAVGLRAVRDDGGAIRFRHALVRGLVAVVEVYMFLAISVVTSLLSPEGKRLGDYLAGTVVVRERAGSKASSALFTPWLPPELAAWASTLDLSRLQPGTALATRQFLTRAPTLQTESRQRLAATLYAEVAAQVSPPPPVGVPSETYLSTVLAERARRSAPPAEAAQTAPPLSQPPAPPPSTTDGFAAPG